jgi:hypothetical protein
MTAFDRAFPFSGTGPGTIATDLEWQEVIGAAYPIPGVIPSTPQATDNELEPFADSTGLHIKVKSGRVVMFGEFGGVDSQKTTPDISAVGAIPGGQSRIDRLVARFQRTGTRGMSYEWLTGTAGASPTAPALTQNANTWETPIAQVQGIKSTTTTIAAAGSAITSTVAVVVDERQWASTSLNAPWQSWTPVVGGAWTRNNGTVIGRYRVADGGVYWHFQYTIGTLDGAGTGLTIAGFPFAPVLINAKGDLNIKDVSVPTSYPGRVELDIASTTATLLYAAEFSAPGPVFYAPITATSPLTWAAGDTFNASGFYEI